MQSTKVLQFGTLIMLLGLIMAAAFPQAIVMFPSPINIYTLRNLSIAGVVVALGGFIVGCVVSFGRSKRTHSSLWNLMVQETLLLHYRRDINIRFYPEPNNLRINRLEDIHGTIPISRKANSSESQDKVLFPRTQKRTS